MAESEVARLLTPSHNYAVVQLPGRRYPGVVFQGDSLNIACHAARDVAARAAELGNADLVEAAHDLVDLLQRPLLEYEAVLEREGLALPYVKE